MFEGTRPRSTASDDELREVRGDEIAMIFQDPMTSLNPVYRIGDQIVEQIRAHETVLEGEALDRAVELMERVGIPRAARARATPTRTSSPAACASA